MNEAQLLLFEGTHQTQSAHYIKIWDKQGLLIKGLANNWYIYPTDNKTARAKSLAKVKHRLNQLISSGLVGWCEIVSTDTRQAQYQWGDKDIVLKHYPNSPMKKKELKP